MQKAGIPDPLMAAELAQELQAIEANIAYVQWEINCATQPQLAPQPGPPAARSYPAPRSSGSAHRTTAGACGQT